MYAAALFEVLGTDFAEAFFNSLDTNKVTMLSSNSEVRLRVAAGDFALGVADTDDFKMVVKEGQPLGFVFPDQEAFGTLVIPSALVLIADGPHPDQGKRFIDFLLQPETQRLLATVQPGKSVLERTPSLGNIKPMEVDYGKLVSQAEGLSRGFLKEWVAKQK